MRTTASCVPNLSTLFFPRSLVRCIAASLHPCSSQIVLPRSRIIQYMKKRSSVLFFRSFERPRPSSTFSNSRICRALTCSFLQTSIQDGLQYRFQRQGKYTNQPSRSRSFPCSRCAAQVFIPEARPRTDWQSASFLFSAPSPRPLHSKSDIPFRTWRYLLLCDGLIIVTNESVHG